MDLLAKITLLDCDDSRQLHLGILIPAASNDPLRDAIAAAHRKHPGAKLQHIEFALPHIGDGSGDEGSAELADVVLAA